MKMIKIPELGIEVQEDYAQTNCKISEIEIPKGELRFLTMSELLYIFNKHQNKFKNLEKIKEAIQNPIEKYRAERPIWALWFWSVDNRSSLLGNGDLIYGVGVRGVRFCQDLK